MESNIDKKNWIEKEQKMDDERGIDVVLLRRNVSLGLAALQHCSEF